MGPMWKHAFGDLRYGTNVLDRDIPVSAGLAWGEGRATYKYLMSASIEVGDLLLARRLH